MSWSVPFALHLTGILVGAGILVLAITRPLGPRARRVGNLVVPYLLAAGAMIGLYALWQYVLDLLVVHTAGAVGRGRSIALLERHLRFPSEASLQRLCLHAPWLIRFSNKYYADVDFPALSACLLWLFARHRNRFARYLIVLVILTTICALVQAIPVAPPRLVPGFGFIDMGTRFGELVYSPGADQPGVLTTMPSVHVAWAAFVAATAIGAGEGRWRYAFGAHPIITLFVVVVTGNHFWLDGLAALGIDAVAFAVVALVIHLFRRHRPPRVERPGAPDERRLEPTPSVPGTMPT